MISIQDLMGLPHYEITDIQRTGGQIVISARYTGPKSCPGCSGSNLRNRGRIVRKVRHVCWATERVWLLLEGHRWRCRGCGLQFRERFPGVLPFQHSSEAFRSHVFHDHWDGINRSRVARREGIGSATVERHCAHFLERLAAERSGNPCPQVLGIDEHFFSRKQGYATTFCDLKNHSVYDVVLGRSEASLESYLQRLNAKENVRVICIDLAPVYRVIIRKHFPNARIVADRFHVIRIINHHFLACWRELDPVGSRNRGLLSLMRRHRHRLSLEQSENLQRYLAQCPVLGEIYRFKQRLCYLLLKKNRNRKQCEKLAPRFLRAVYQLQQAGLPQLVSLGS